MDLPPARNGMDGRDGKLNHPESRPAVLRRHSETLAHATVHDAAPPGLTA